MQIPEYWVEATVEGRVNRKRRVVRRYGWSETSEAEAKAMAEQRAAAAWSDLLAGRRVSGREAKRPYGGAGFPIREQILRRIGSLVITRNSYGAHCLNEPDVLFADLDLEPRMPALVERLFDVAAFGGAVAAVYFYFKGRSDRDFGACGLSAAAILFAITLLIVRAQLRGLTSVTAATSRRMLKRVRKVAKSLPDSRWAIYESPGGFRVIALHATFDPRHQDTIRLLQSLGSDPAYVQMCELQACFRARLTGKPWRMKVRKLVPRPGVWPIRPERRSAFDQWVAEYEAASTRFAACRFLEDLGDGRIHPRCAEVQRLHDQLSRAKTTLPLA